MKGATPVRRAARPGHRRRAAAQGLRGRPPFAHRQTARTPAQADAERGRGGEGKRRIPQGFRRWRPESGPSGLQSERLLHLLDDQFLELFTGRTLDRVSRIGAGHRGPVNHG